MSADRGGEPAPSAVLAADEPVSAPPGARFGTFYSLGIPNFRMLWIGHASHAAALWMEQIARPWLVLLMTNDNPVHVGGVVAVRTLPQLLFGLWAGVIADRFDRKRVLLATKASVFVLSIVFAVILVTGRMELWMIYAAAILRGSFMAFDQPARNSLIGSIVPEHALTNAVALMSSTQNVLRFAGVIASGVVIELLGIEGAFITIAVIYSGAVFATWRLNLPPHQKSQNEQGMLQSLMEGLRYSAHHPMIRGVLLMSVFFFCFGMSWQQVFASLFARSVFDIGAVGFSALVAVSSLGAVASALLIASRYPKRLGMLLNGAMLSMGLLLVAFSVATYLPGPAGLLLPFVIVPFVGLSQVTFNSLNNALLISVAPVALRGRVLSIVSLDRAMMSAGAAIGGVLAATAGVQVAQIVFGIVLLCAGILVFLLAPSLRTYEVP